MCSLEHIHSPIPVLRTHSPLQLTWPIGQVSWSGECVLNTTTRDLNHHLQVLLAKAVVSSTSTTYSTSIRHYHVLCPSFQLTPVPATKEMVTLFATPARPSRCVWQWSLFCTSPERGVQHPMLKLAIRGMKRLYLYVFVPFDLVLHQV